MLPGPGRGPAGFAKVREAKSAISRWNLSRSLRCLSAFQTGLKLMGSIWIYLELISLGLIWDEYWIYIGFIYGI